MKNTTLNAGFGLLLATFLLNFSLQAQNYLSISQSNPKKAALTANMEADTFKITVVNTSSVSLSQVDVTPVFPNNGIVYAGYVSVSSGTVSTSSGTTVSFAIPQLSPGQKIILTYTARATCEVFANITSGSAYINRADVTFTLPGGARKKESLTSATSYNLLYPRLNISAEVDNQLPFENTKIGDYTNLLLGSLTEAHKIRVTNTGTGAADTVIIRIKPEPEIRYNGFSNSSGTVFIPATYVGSEVVITLYGSLLQDFIKTEVDFTTNFVQGEDLLLYEDFTVVSCGSEGLLTDYYVETICEKNNCRAPGDSHDDSNVSVIEGQPELSISVGNKEKVASFCSDGEEVVFYYTNKSTDFRDFASNVLLEIISYSHRSPHGFSLNDFKINGQSLPASMVNYLSSIQWIDYPTNQNPGYQIDLSTNTNPLVAQDLDNDGQMDDLGAGMTLTVTAKLHFDDEQYFETQCPINYYSLIGLPQLYYNASCSAIRKSKINHANGAYYHAYMWPNGKLSNLISGTTDMKEGVAKKFKFCTGSFQDQMQFFKCPADSFYAQIYLPDGYGLKGTSALFTSIAGDSYSVPAHSDGEVITIYGGGQSYLPTKENVWEGCYSLPLILSCDSAVGLIARKSTIGFSVNYICDTCDLVQQRVCWEYEIYNHAGCTDGSSSCSGITTTSFDLVRTSFGFTDQTLTERVSNQSYGVNVHAAYPYDSLQSTTKGHINGFDYDKLFCEVRYDAADKVLDWVGGTIELYDPSGTLMNTYPVSTAPVVQAKAPHYSYIFEIPNAYIPNTASGFTAVFKHNWTVINSPLVFANAAYDLSELRSSFFYTKRDTIYQCDEWGAAFSLYNPNTYPVVYTNGTSGCAPISVKMDLRNAGGISGNDFPNEYRPLIAIDKRITFHLPEGFTYLGDAYTIAITGVSAAGTPEDVQVPLTPLFFDADSVVFEYDWTQIDKYNFNQTSDSLKPLLVFKIQPDCSRQDTAKSVLNFSFTKYAYVLNPAVWVKQNWTNDPNVKGAYNFISLNPKPNITLNTGAYVVDGFSKKVKWLISICNKTDAKHPKVTSADFVWIDADNALSNTGNITIERFYETVSSSKTAIHYAEGTATNSYLQLGAIAANTCKSYTLEGTYSSCTPGTDTLHLSTGWNCHAYPDTNALETASCMVATDLLALRYKIANLDMVALQVPTGVHSICDTLDYVVELQSTAQGFMYDVHFWVDMPAGAQLLGGEYNYLTKNNSWKALPAPADSLELAKGLGWHLSEVLGEWQKYAGGFIGSQKPDSAKIQLRFSIALSCSFDPADSITLHANGLTNCGDLLQYMNIQRILIEGFTALDQLEVNLVNPDSLSCAENGDIVVSVRNTGSFATQFTNQARVFVSDAFAIVSSCAGATITPVSGGQEISWTILPGLAPGAQAIFQLVVVPIGTVGYNPETVLAWASYTGESSCGTSLCYPSTSLSKVESTIVAGCETCVLEAGFSVQSACLGTQSCFTLSDATTAGTDFIHSWQFGDGSVATEASPCHTYASAGTFTVSHTLISLVENCTRTEVLEINVLPLPQGHIELLGCNPFCEGSQVYLTVKGDYERLEWYEVSNPAVVIGTSDTIAITAAGIYGAVLYNGPCSFRCAEIVLEQSPKPEIDLPDTSFCAGDSLLICAGGGFDSYKWELDGKVINTSDSCIWVSQAGVYRLVVGQKPPYGCCTCKGVDTFTVTFNHLSLGLADLALCEGASDSLRAIVSGGTAPYDFFWFTTGESEPAIEVSTSGNFIAMVSDQNGCVAIDSATVSVKSFSFSHVHLQDTICIKDTVCFDSHGEGLHRWTILKSGVVLTVSVDSNFCYAFPGVGDYTVIHDYIAPCGSHSDTNQVVVVPAVEACIVLLGQNPFCPGDVIHLTINDPYNQVSTVNWYLNDVLLAVGDTLTVTQPGTYRAEVIDNRGCTNECMCMVLTQKHAPALDLPQTVTICNGGGPVSLNAGNGYDQYIWFKNNQFLAYGVSSIQVTEAGTYRVEIVNENGCKAVDSTIVKLASEYVIIGSSAMVVCRNTAFKLCTPYDVNYSYEWFIAANSTDFGTAIANSDTNKLNLNGSDLLGPNTWFNLRVVNTLTGCTYTAKIRIVHSITCGEVTVYPNPVASGGKFKINYDLIGTQVEHARFEMRNMLGALVAVYDADVSVQEKTIDLYDVSSGVYHLNLIADGQLVDTQRLVVSE